MIKDVDFSKTELPDFKKSVDKKLFGMLGDFYDNVPGATYLKDAKEINVEYYKRSVVEIILRLRMKRTIDALTIHYFTKTNPFLAKKWAQYTEDEMLHDRMFAADLKRLGMSEEEIYSNKPYLSTKLLQGYFYYGIEHEGRPLASLTSSYFIEKMSLYTQPSWMENVESVLGKNSAKGHLAHIKHDIEDDHDGFVWNVIMTFVRSDEDKQKIMEHLEDVFQLFCSYYSEIFNDFFEDKKFEFRVA
jgi:hypothetical protein